MFHWDADTEFEASKDENIASELEDERAQVLEIQLRHDERPRLRPLDIKETPGQKKRNANCDGRP